MIANLINTVLGLALVWAAVLEPDLLHSPWVLIVGAVVIFVLEIWARLSDHHPWQSTTNMVLAVCLLAVGLLKLVGASDPLVQFWGVFWIGTAVSIVALWAALYRPNVQRARA
jgi:hypothetical protein